MRTVPEYRRIRPSGPAIGRPPAFWSVFVGTFLGTGAVAAIALLMGFIVVFSGSLDSLLPLVFFTELGMLIAAAVGAVAGIAAAVADRLLPRTRVLFTALAASFPAGAVLAALTSSDRVEGIVAPLVAGSLAAVAAGIATRTWIARRARWDTADSYVPGG